MLLFFVSDLRKFFAAQSAVCEFELLAQKPMVAVFHRLQERNGG